MKLGAVFLFLFLVATEAFSQSTGGGQTDSDWMHIQSDNGEFSVEIPKKHKIFFDAKGFSLTRSGTAENHELQDMRLVSSYVDDTLLSLETYDAGKGALRAVREADEGNKKNTEFREVKKGSYTEGNLVARFDTATMKRVYLSSKDRIYILTIAFRGVETPASRRFIDSIKFDPGKSVAAGDAKKLSELPVEKLQLEQIEPPQPSSGKTPISTSKRADDNTLPYAILSKPRASYTHAARQGGVSGSMRLKVTLSEDGFIPKIVVVGKGLDGGLVRQTILAAMRLKFLPKVVNGKPQTVVVTMEYGFNIY